MLSKICDMLKAIVLIGGASVRMGTDKFLIEANGLPQYLHLHRMIEALGISTYISCSAAQTDQIDQNIPYLIDEFASIGPIGGLATAIKHDPTSDWLVGACDLINLQPETIKELVTIAPRKGVITFQREDIEFPETTITIYCQDVFTTVKQAIRQKKYSLQGVLKASDVQKITPANPAQLKNVNTRADL